MKAFIATAMAALLAIPAGAQGNNCGPRDIVVERLAAKYSETRQSMGLGSNNALIEVFASQDTGSWTITVTHPNGVMCFVASGQQFEVLSEALPPKGDDL